MGSKNSAIGAAFWSLVDKFSIFVHMINNKSNIEMQLATYKSMLTKASNDLAKSKQLVGLL